MSKNAIWPLFSSSIVKKIFRSQALRVSWKEEISFHVFMIQIHNFFFMVSSFSFLKAISSIRNLQLSPLQETKSRIAQYTLANCYTLLEMHNLAQFIPNFVQAEVDGPLLVTLCNPDIGGSILEGMGIVHSSDKEAVITAVKKEMTK